jgi:hypothetical protein
VAKTKQAIIIAIVNFVNKIAKTLYLFKLNLKLLKSETNITLRKAKTVVYTLKDGKKRENIEKIKAMTITNPKKLKFPKSKFLTLTCESMLNP